MLITKQTKHMKELGRGKEEALTNRRWPVIGTDNSNS